MLPVPPVNILAADESARYSVNYGITDVIMACNERGIDAAPYIVRIMWSIAAAGVVLPTTFGPRVYRLAKIILEEIDDK